MKDQMFHKVVLFLYVLKVASTKYRETIDWTIEYASHTGLMMDLVLMAVLRSSEGYSTRTIPL